MGPRPGTQALPRFPHSGAEAMPRPKPLLELVVRSFVHMDRGHTEGEQHNKRRSHCGEDVGMRGEKCSTGGMWVDTRDI